MRAPTSKLLFEALSTTFFDWLDIFSDATNLTITLVVFVSALPAPEARKHVQQRFEAALCFWYQKHRLDGPKMTSLFNHELCLLADTSNSITNRDVRRNVSLALFSEAICF